MNSGSATMTASERDATRRRLQIWQEAQPLLEEQRWRELMALTDEQALKMTRSLLSRQTGHLTGVPRYIRFGRATGVVPAQPLSMSLDILVRFDRLYAKLQQR